MTPAVLLHGDALEEALGAAPLWPYGDASLTLVLGAALGLVVVVVALLRRAGVSAESTRTLAHVCTALAVAAIPWGFHRLEGPVLLALMFALVNFWTMQAKHLGALHDARPGSYGTVAMPLALVLAALLFEPNTSGATGAAWSIAWATLALADPLAGVVGRRFGRGGTKSWAGSAAFFGAAFAISLVGLMLWHASHDGAAGISADGGRYSRLLAHALTAASVMTACEWLGRRGWDNLFVILGGYFALVAVPHPPEGAWALWLPLVGAVAFGWTSYRLRLLSASGAVAAGLFGWLVLQQGGWPHLLSGVGFFVLSSLLSRWNRRRSAAADAIAEKGHRRDAYQVAANGFVAAAALALGHGPLVLAAWTGAFAAAAADTWATEIGTRFGGTPRLVTTGQQVPVGTSGGISLAGLLGGLAGAAVVGALAWAGLWIVGQGIGDGFSGGMVRAQIERAATYPLGALGVWTALALGAGLAGALFDSLLGATVQRRFRRPDGVLTEKPTTDGVPNQPAGGWRWMTNDTVNLAATLVGAVVGILVYGLVGP